MVKEVIIDRTHGPGIYYPVIPYEMLYTDEVAPQVVVEIDGLPAACTGLQCDYQYEEPIGLVTGMTVEGLNVSLTGSNLTLDLVSVTLAKTACEITANTDLTIECTMAHSWPSGRWLPEVTRRSRK